jgi:hypothetical protein
MPDIPIDTLFIVGLLIASFVGKLFEGRVKRKKESPVESLPKPNQTERELTDGKNLGDLLRDAFSELVEPNLNEDTPVKNKRESVSNVKESAKPDKANTIARPLEPTINNRELDVPVHKGTLKNSKVWLRTEGVKSNQNLRRALLVKEVLGKPPGLS